MNETEPVRDGVVVGGQPVADFSHFTSADEFAAISRIEHVALAIVPDTLSAAYMAIPSEGVAATIYVPAGNVRMHTGVLAVGGDGLGAPDDVLIVVGMLIVTSPITGSLPRRIYAVGSVMAPRGSEPLLGAALAGGTGSVSYYPYSEGLEIKVLSGQVKLSAAMLANPVGGPDDILIVAGQSVVTGEITTVGYRYVIVSGQLAAPAGSRDTLEPRIQVQGQAGWYEDGDLRAFYSDTTLGQDFFRLLERPVSLVVFGDLTIAPGVDEAMMRDKIASIILFGDAVAPPELVGVLQLLATDVFGDIRASGGPGS
jgi:hypothetical protein